MSQDGLVATAQTLVEEIATAEGARSFDHRVIEFTRLLAGVPDSSRSEITTADLDTLRELAERVIQAIESRLEVHNDRQAVQSDLADAVYRIRHGLEEMDRWRRHFFQGP